VFEQWVIFTFKTRELLYFIFPLLHYTFSDPLFMRYQIL